MSRTDPGKNDTLRSTLLAVGAFVVVIAGMAVWQSSSTAPTPAPAPAPEVSDEKSATTRPEWRLDEPFEVRAPALEETAPAPTEAPDPAERAEIDEAGPAPVDLVSAGPDDDVEKRVNSIFALRELAKRGDDDALEALYQSLGDPSPEVRAVAVRSLAKLEKKDAYGPLAPFADDPNPEVRRQVAKGLKNASDEAAGPLLVELLDDDSPRVVVEAIESLSKRKDYDAQPELAALIGSSDHDVTVAAGRALRKLGDYETSSQALAIVAKGLDKTDPNDRIETLREIRDFGGDERIPYLRTAMSDPDPKVAKKAASILDRIESKQ